MISSINTSPVLISIILPTHNGARYLRQSIDSCLTQTYADFELIIVDDGSDDPRVAAILTPQTDPRIRVLRLEKNAGLPAALNAGFREARGTMLTWTSDDNLFRPNALEVMTRELKRGDADFVYARATSIDEEGKAIGSIVPRPADQLALDNCIGPCFLFTRRVWGEIGTFDSAMRLVEDYDYWVRVSKRFHMRPLADDLYLYRQHKENLTSIEGRDRVREMVDKVRHRHFSHADIMAAEGMRAFDRGNLRAARPLLLGALVRSPLRPRLYRPAAITLLPPPLVRMIVKGKQWVWKEKVRIKN